MRFGFVLVRLVLGLLLAAPSAHAAVEQIGATTIRTFVARKTMGKVTGMSAWGGQRRIAPQEGSFSVLSSPTEHTFQVGVSGPVIEQKFKGSPGYQAFGSFTFQNMTLPLKEGATYEGVGSSGGKIKATYGKGKLLIEDTHRVQAQGWSMSKGVFAVDEVQAKRVEVKTTPDLTQVSGVRFISSKQDVTPTGLGKLQTATRASLMSLTDK